MADKWKEVHKKYPNLPYSAYAYLEIKFFLRGIFSWARDVPMDILWFLRDPFLGSPSGLTKDCTRGRGPWWWAKALSRAGVLCLLFYNPLKYLRECRDRKDWWDGITDGQRHFWIEEQNRAVEGLIECGEKLMESLKKPRALNEKGEYEHTNESEM